MGDAEDEAKRLAEGLVAPEVGWPRVGPEPTAFGEPGRFARAFPLSWVRGFADPCEASQTPTLWLGKTLAKIVDERGAGLEDALLMCVRLGAVPAELSDKRRAKAGGGCHAQVRADVAVTIPSGSAHR